MDYVKIIAAYKKHGTMEKAAKSLGMARETYRCKLRQAQAALPESTSLTGTGKLKILNVNATIVYFTDAHNQPSLPLDRFLWLSRFVDDVNPEFLVDGGDFDDLQSLCAHERNDTWKGKFKPAFQDELEHSNAARQLLYENIKSPCAKYVTFGNHEQRLFDFENNNPEIYGMMQHAYLDILDKYGWGVTMYRDYKTVADIDFTHVPMTMMNRPVGGKNPCNIVSRDSIKDVCFGHTHGLGLQVNHKLGPSRSVTAFNGGCFMPDGYVPSYAKGSQKHFWYGAHVLQSINGRLHIRESITMKELKDRYA